SAAAGSHTPAPAGDPVAPRSLAGAPGAAPSGPTAPSSRADEPPAAPEVTRPSPAPTSPLPPVDQGEGLTGRQSRPGPIERAARPARPRARSLASPRGGPADLARARAGALQEPARAPEALRTAELRLGEARAALSADRLDEVLRSTSAGVQTV